MAQFHPGGKYYGNHLWLEKVHNWIQWLFPTLTPSRYNQDYRALDHREARLIADDAVCRHNLVLNYRCFLDFIGFTLEDETTGALMRHDDAAARLRNLDESRHNHLRVTRVLACLGACGLAHLQRALVEVLIDEAYTQHTLGALCESFRTYFIPVIQDPTARFALLRHVNSLRSQDELVESSTDGSDDEEPVESRDAEQPPAAPQYVAGIFFNGKKLNVENECAVKASGGSWGATILGVVQREDGKYLVHVRYSSTLEEEWTAPCNVTRVIDGTRHPASLSLCSGGAVSSSAEDSDGARSSDDLRHQPSSCVTPPCTLSLDHAVCRTVLSSVAPPVSPPDVPSPLYLILLLRSRGGDLSSSDDDGDNDGDDDGAEDASDDDLEPEMPYRNIIETRNRRASERYALGRDPLTGSVRRGRNMASVVYPLPWRAEGSAVATAQKLVSKALNAHKFQGQKRKDISPAFCTNFLRFLHAGLDTFASTAEERRGHTLRRSEMKEHMRVSANDALQRTHMLLFLAIVVGGATAVSFAAIQMAGFHLRADSALAMVVACVTGFAVVSLRSGLSCGLWGGDLRRIVVPVVLVSSVAGIATVAPPMVQDAARLVVALTTVVVVGSAPPTVRRLAAVTAALVFAVVAACAFGVVRVLGLDGQGTALSLRLPSDDVGAAHAHPSLRSAALRACAIHLFPVAAWAYAAFFVQRHHSMMALLAVGSAARIQKAGRPYDQIEFLSMINVVHSHMTRLKDLGFKSASLLRAYRGIRIVLRAANVSGDYPPCIEDELREDGEELKSFKAALQRDKTVANIEFMNKRDKEVKLVRADSPQVGRLFPFFCRMCAGARAQSHHHASVLLLLCPLPCPKLLSRFPLLTHTATA